MPSLLDPQNDLQGASDQGSGLGRLYQIVMDAMAKQRAQGGDARGLLAVPPGQAPGSWYAQLPNYQTTDPNFREFGTGDAGRMFKEEIPTAPPPLYPTPPGELPPTADRNTMDDANTRYWRPYPPGFRIPI